MKSLLVLAEIVEKGSMRAAAQSLDMTPSAVSQHIAKLETQYKVKLFTRSTRKIVPTDAGLVMMEYCSQLKHQIKDTERALESLQNEALGDLRIALPSGLIQAEAFQRFVKQMQGDYPNIQLILCLDDNLLDLKTQQIDIALRGGEHALDAPDLIARPLQQWSWVICASPEYLKYHSPIKEPEELFQHNWVLFHPIGHTLKQGHKHYDLYIEKGTQCSQIFGVKPLVLSGAGLGMFIQGEVKEEIEKGVLVPVLMDWELSSTIIYAVTTYRVQSVKTKVALQVLQQCFME